VQGPIISIVDDDASLRTAAVRLLRSMGFAVHAFASAQEFLQSPQRLECVEQTLERSLGRRNDT
jgi:FixJ family two-component response regulator